MIIIFSNIAFLLRISLNNKAKFIVHTKIKFILKLYKNQRKVLSLNQLKFN